MFVLATQSCLNQRHGRAYGIVRKRARNRSPFNCSAATSNESVAELPSLLHGIAHTTVKTQVSSSLQQPNCLACVWKPGSDAALLREAWTAAAAAAARTRRRPANGVLTARHVPVADIDQQRAALRHLFLEMGLSVNGMETFYEPLLEMIELFCLAFEQNVNRIGQHARSPLRAVDLRLSFLDSTPCPRFHVDSVPLRLLCTLQGPGTEIARETFVWRERFEAARSVGGAYRIRKSWWQTQTLSACTAEEHAQHVVFRRQVSTPLAISVPQYIWDPSSGRWLLRDSLPDAPVERLVPWHAVLLKGTGWIRADGDASAAAAIHRSPCMQPTETRWLFHIDAHVSMDEHGA
jgi:hypothetical protein